MSYTELLEHVNTKVQDLNYDTTIYEMSNLNFKRTGINNWIIYISSKIAGKRPRIKLAKTSQNTTLHNASSVFYFDVVELDETKDHSNAPTSIKNRVINFLKDTDNNRNLMTLWNHWGTMDQDDVDKILKGFNHF